MANIKKSKISYRELERRLKSNEKHLLDSYKKNQTYFNIMTLLGGKLYIADPEDEIFSNGTFVEEMLENIKKVAQNMKEKPKPKASEVKEEKSEV